MFKQLACNYIIFCLLTLSGLFTLQANANVKDIKLLKLGVEEGLSQGTVLSVFQDKAGFIWIGTDSGLNIYDGYTFKILPGPDGNFKKFAVEGLLQDAEGLIWLNVYDQGLYTYNPTTNDYQLILAQSLLEKTHFISNLTEGENNTFWIATSKTVYSYNKLNSTLNVELDLSLELPGTNNINKIIERGNYLILATNVGIFLYHKIENQWRKLPSIITDINNINAVQESKIYTMYLHNNDLYVGTYLSVQRLDISNLDDFYHRKNNLPPYQKLADGLSMWQFYEDEQQLYVTSNQGLSVVNLVAKRLDNLFGFSDVFDDVADNTVRAIFKDNKGMFWLGTAAQGLYLWKPSQGIITNYRYKKNSPGSLSFNEVWGVLSHKKDPSLTWVATANGLNLINNITQNIETFLYTRDTKALYGESHIFQMKYYDENTLVLATYDGVKLFDTVNKKIIKTGLSEEISILFSGEYIAVDVDKNKTIWLANSEGIYKISLDNQSAHLVFDISQDTNYKGIDQDITNLLGFLPDSSMLMFSNNDSLWGVDVETNESTLLYSHPRSNIAEWTYIDNWVVDKNNTLWLTFVGKGLIGLSLPDFKPKYHYTSANSIIHNSGYGVQIDADGDLWISSHNGLFVMDTEHHHFRHFSTKHGFAGKEFNGGAFAMKPNGDLIYGGMSGVSIFSPVKLKSLQADDDFSVTITNVSVLSRQLDLPLILNPDENIKLRYDDVGIRVDFSTLIYATPERIRYEYKLLGSNEVSYPLTYDNNITFPTLASGKHILEIRAESPISGKYSNPTRITFVVNYAPWASPLAYLAYMLVLASFIGIWVHKRQQQRKALLYAHEEVKYRENRLQLALTGSNSEVWDWQAKNNLMFGKRASEELGYPDFSDFYPYRDHVGLIHPEDKKDFLSRWKIFVQNETLPNNFSCTYRLRNNKGEWLWYKDLGKVVAYSENGEPLRITGSYTNITDTKASEEKALYYGDAFKQTKDWVFIISENFTRVTANKSLCGVFGWQKEEFEFSDKLFGFTDEKRVQYRKVLSNLKENEHWKSEELVKTPKGEEFHVIVNITVSRNEANNQLHYICVFSDITAQKTAEKELRYLANYDHLTSLPNRSLLLERIRHAMDYSNRKNTSIALFFIDLDRFKQINDTLGHDCGDLLLQEITSRLKTTLRIDDTIARIGGDEFVVLLEYFKGNSQLGRIAQKLIESIGAPVSLKGNFVSVGASIGIALYPDDAKDSDELLRNADVAMYYSKQLGRNTFQFFTKRMNHETNSRLAVESNLKQAIQKNELINHYQPIVDSTIEKPIGFELLLRWQTEDRLVSPLVFIPIAEELGLIIEITESAIDRGLTDLAKWRETNEELFLSVNLSPLHFAKDSLVPFIKKQLFKHDLPASALKLEVTESALISDPNKAISIMTMLSTLGILLALDDFGTGYSSLSYLKQLPLQIIKIDRSFVSGINVNSADEAIVDATIVLAKRLNMKCIAEGVETAEQLEYLAKRKCKHIQGYFYSRPLSGRDLMQYLTQFSHGPTLKP